MYRLHGQDANWLYRETLTTPMHTLKIFLVSLGPGQTVDFDNVKTSTARLLHEVPMLRQRPVFVPYGLHHPVMIEDPEFDLQYHLNRAALPAPGSMRELEEVIAHIDSHPLDQTRPLWQFWIVEGLENGQIALVQKIHHTLADGMASVNFIMRVWQSGYMDPHKEPPPCIYRSTVAIRRQADPATSPTLKGQLRDIPKLRWNHAISSRRSFALEQLQLDELKALKDKLGGTLNDAVLGVVAGSLRNFLIEHDELPDRPLLVTVPVSRDPGNTGRESGNSTAVTTTLLHVEIADPQERYQAIRAATDLGKRELEIIGRDTFSLLMHYIPPALQVSLAENIYHKQLANEDKFKLPSNLSVSNVPGPREKFAAQGNVVEDLYSAGPLVEGMGLNITVWSYAGHMNFTLVGCMKALPDVHKIAEGLRPAMLELGGEPAEEAENTQDASPDQEARDPHREAHG
jgi:hypothetical protein